MGGILPSLPTAHYLLHNPPYLRSPVHNLMIHPFKLRVDEIRDPHHVRSGNGKSSRYDRSVQDPDPKPPFFLFPPTAGNPENNRPLERT